MITFLWIAICSGIAYTLCWLFLGWEWMVVFIAAVVTGMVGLLLNWARAGW